MNFSPKRVIETEIFTVDFTSMLGPRETIKPNTVGEPGNVVWTCTVVTGVDANVAALIQGAPTVTGGMVSQMIGSGLPSVEYAPICTVKTSLGQTLVLPTYGDGLLLVTP